MNYADDEINLFLPLMFAVSIVFITAIFGLIIWSLNKMQVIKFSKKSQLFSVFRAAVLSLVSLLALGGFVAIVIFVIQMIKNFVSG